MHIKIETVVYTAVPQNVAFRVHGLGCCESEAFPIESILPCYNSYCNNSVRIKQAPAKCISMSHSATSIISHHSATVYAEY